MDAGLSGVELERRMHSQNLLPDTLSGLVVTHEHTDHIQAAGILSRRYGIPLYINSKTYSAASKKLGRVDSVNLFECGTCFSINDLEINPFSISHDAIDPLGMTVSFGSVKLGIATDLGIATHLVKQHLKNCSLLYVESNHDPGMLNAGPYPWYLKQRVKGRTGHLSNQDAAQLVAEVRTQALGHVILAHLSEQNNKPELALQAMNQALNLSRSNLSSADSSVSVEVARPDRPGPLVSL